MSTQSSIISGLAGAVIASAAWYFTSNNAENKVADSEQNASKNSEMVAAAPAPQDETCRIRKDHAISWQDAQSLTGAYLNNPSTPKLLASDGSTLKGWYIEKCVIEDLFRIYPESDGLQLYVALKTPAGANPYHDLVWVASQLVKDGDDMVRMNCMNQPETVMDLSVHCPVNCPSRNPLPN